MLAIWMLEGGPELLSKVGIGVGEVRVRSQDHNDPFSCLSSEKGDKECGFSRKGSDQPENSIHRFHSISLGGKFWVESWEDD